MGARYFVVFCDSELTGIKWLKPDFRHCYVMRKEEFGTVWTVIQYGGKGLQVVTYLCEDFPEPKDFAIEGATIMEVECNQKQLAWTYLCNMNCVEVVKAVLGIRKPFLYTPYQLYRWLYGRRRDTSPTTQKTQARRKETARDDQSTKTGPAT